MSLIQSIKKEYQRVLNENNHLKKRNERLNNIVLKKKEKSKNLKIKHTESSGSKDDYEYYQKKPSKQRKNKQKYYDYQYYDDKDYCDD